MGISESTLEGWTGTGADKGSKRTRRRIYNALRSERSPLVQRKDDFSVYLQGSYANTTYIRGDSDVDVVARLESAWHRKLDELSERERERYEEDHKDADYGRRDFYDDVVTALRIKFGGDSVTRENKAIKISSDDSSLPLDADVVACQEHRKYHSYPATGEPKYDTGIFFRTRIKNRGIVNYPQYHREAGSQKNELAGRNYKETIRMFKNARNQMRDKGILSNDAAPSYYIEGLLYNVPHYYYKKTSLRNRYDSIVSYLERTDIAEFEEQCGMFPLFASDEDRWTQWKAEKFIEGLQELWEEE